MTGREALAAAVPRLAAAGVAAPEREARRLLAHVLGLSGAGVTPVLGEAVPPAARAAFEDGVECRAARQPMAQITGVRAFYGRNFHVSREVLDPRPETETLVEVALGGPARRVLDLGTGSGCLLVTLLAEWPEARGVGTDISAPALAVAGANARRHGVAGRAIFAVSDWLDGVAGRFDLIVANPPYVADPEFARLSPEVRWEPEAALRAGEDGLAAHRAIAGRVRDHLVPGGRLLVEVGAGQSSAVAELFCGAGLDGIAVHADLSGRDRLVRAAAPRPPR